MEIAAHASLYKFAHQYAVYERKQVQLHGHVTLAQSISIISKRGILQTASGTAEVILFK